MNPFIVPEDIAEKELLPGFFARLVHTDRLTVAHFRIEKGSMLPMHHHPHEQVTNVIEGELEMTVDGRTSICKAGHIAVIPPNTVHSGRAITDCRLIDVFQPVREDYRDAR